MSGHILFIGFKLTSTYLYPHCDGAAWGRNRLHTYLTSFFFLLCGLGLMLYNNPNDATPPEQAGEQKPLTEHRGGFWVDREVNLYNSSKIARGRKVMKLLSFLRVLYFQSWVKLCLALHIIRPHGAVCHLLQSRDKKEKGGQNYIWEIFKEQISLK